MKLFVLGTGTCLGSIPGTRARQPPLFALDVAPPRADPAWILFDCSEGARFRLPDAGIDPRAVAHVAVSHPHPDHAALPQFVQGRACEEVFRPDPARDLSLSVYLPRESAASIETLWRWHQPEDDGRATSRFELDVVGVGDGFTREVLPGVRLRAFDVFHGHGRCPAVAYRVEARGGLVFVYSGDTGLCEGLARAAEGATMLLCEASARIGTDMSSGHGHLNPRQAGDVARDAGIEQLVLTHYSGLDPVRAMLEDARASGFTRRLAVADDSDVLAIG